MTKDDIAQLMSDTSGMIWGDEAHFQRFAKHLIDIEREACAKMCDPSLEQKQDPDSYLGGVEGILLLEGVAESIRARGTT